MVVSDTQHLLQDFESVSDHFTTLRSKGLTHYFSVREEVFEMKTETIMNIIFGEWSL